MVTLLPLFHFSSSRELTKVYMSALNEAPNIDDYEGISTTTSQQQVFFKSLIVYSNRKM